MRYIWMIFGILLVAMLAVLPRLRTHQPKPAPERLPVQQVAYSPTSLAPAGRTDLARADSIVSFGLAQRGTPYVWAGTSPLTGFDCSGFIMYTFAHFGVPIPHSTSLLIDVGRPVARTEAQPGDLVVFTGTAATSTTPGHAGIVISRRGELPLRFVHASSSRREPFVKVSQVEDSDYERRFMQVRRVLGPGTGVVAVARAKAPVAGAVAPGRVAAPVAAVAALPARPVAVQETAVPPAPLPKRLPKKPVATRKPTTARTAATKIPATRKSVTKPAAKKISGKATVKPKAATSKKTATTKKRTSAR